MAGKIVIFLNGGLVQNIITNEPMQVMVIDADVEGCDEVRRIMEWDFNKNCPSEDPSDLYDVFNGGDREPHVNEAIVDYYFDQMLKEIEHADEMVPEMQDAKGKGE
jgi:hypothetical protein